MSGSHDHTRPPASGFEELLRLQSSFQQSLTDATMNYLRQLQGLVGPVTPGTIVQRTEALARTLTLAPGSTAEMDLRVENRQRVHAMVTPMLTPLVLDTGTTWFAEAGFSPPTALLATDDIGVFRLRIAAPAEMPLGVYRGAILIYGAAEGVIPLEVSVARDRPPKPAAKPKTATKAATTRKAATAAKPKTKTPRKTGARDG